MANLKELNKLEAYLKEHGYDYVRTDKEGWVDPFGRDFERHIIKVYDKETRTNVLWDAICHYGSYGYEEGLLEVMGEDLIGHEDVEGYLTADDIIAMLEGGH